MPEKVNSHLDFYLIVKNLLVSSYRATLQFLRNPHFYQPVSRPMRSEHSYSYRRQLVLSKNKSHGKRAMSTSQGFLYQYLRIFMILLNDSLVLGLYLLCKATSHQKVAIQEASTRYTRTSRVYFNS